MNQAAVQVDELHEGQDEDAQKDKFLTFLIGEEDYGIAIRHVTEIIGIQKITEVPQLPSHVKGVINLRGNVIPVMDVRLRFNLEERDYDDRTCIVVVNVDDTSVGLVVDAVQEVVDIPADDIQLPPQVSQQVNGGCIQGLGKVGDEVKILLDVEKILYEEDLAALASVASPAE